MTCGISPLVPREACAPQAITASEEKQIYSYFRQGNEGAFYNKYQIDEVLSRDVGTDPNTPRRSRKRKRELYGDTVACESKEVRRSERVAAKQSKKRCLNWL
jgi:hypothetical protein